MDVLIKAKLYQKCMEYVEKRIMTAQNAMEEAQRAANEETKSSAGDKFETGRAMMQLERDKNAAQLMEAIKLKNILKQINYNKSPSAIQPGSLIKSSQGTYFIAISLGKVQVEGHQFFVISAQSPIGQQLLGKELAEEINFNGRTIKILDII